MSFAKSDIPSVVSRFGAAAAALDRMARIELHGRVASASGVSISIEGLANWLRLGTRVEVRPAAGPPLAAEVVALRDGIATALAFGPLDGVGTGCRVAVAPPPGLAIDEGWLGRVIDPLGQPIDGLGPLRPGGLPRPLRAAPPIAGQRARLGDRITLGVRAIDAFATCRRGQRLGLFAASGIGKSTLLSMMARGAACDVVVLALVGERGRELREFIEDDLGPEGLARSVVVCATSDAPPLLRRDAAMAAMTIAEHFADQGLHVLLLMDSVTRYAMALREIGLAAGEPPATRGYTPGVFAELPRLLERAGPRRDGCAGAITGLFAVLVEGDDHDEPVADAVRGILDGHVVLDRAIAERGRYPAIDVMRSLSRTVPGCLRPEERELMLRGRAILALQAEMADLVRLGAYRGGSDAAVDEALRLAPRIEVLLSQAKEEPSRPVEATFALLAEALEEENAAAS